MNTPVNKTTLEEVTPKGLQLIMNLGLILRTMWINKMDTCDFRYCNAIIQGHIFVVIDTSEFGNCDEKDLKIHMNHSIKDFALKNTEVKEYLEHIVYDTPLSPERQQYIQKIFTNAKTVEADIKGTGLTRLS